MKSQNDKATEFSVLHDAKGSFIIPNPWDAGSARMLAGLGFKALATSSGAAAGVLGRRDGHITFVVNELGGYDIYTEVGNGNLAQAA